MTMIEEQVQDGLRGETEADPGAGGGAGRGRAAGPGDERVRSPGN